MKKAVFLDRDGVLTELVFNHATREHEPPHTPEDLRFFPGVIESLHLLQNADYDLFLVSNQPDYAKGKTILGTIQAVHSRFDQILMLEKIHFREYYYCYHHPNGIIPEYSFPCECRKPKPFFLLKAARDYKIDITNSWMVGDRGSDIECGKSAGTRTILVISPQSSELGGSSNPDFSTATFKDAVKIILCH